MSFKWTHEEVEKVILLVQQHACIYNVRSKQYLDRTKKAEAFNAICIEMQLLNQAFTVPEIKKKWSNLRIQYMAEKRKMANSKKSGAGASDVVKPKLWCFDQLTFLNSHPQLKESRSNIEDNSLSESFLDDSTDQPSSIDLEDFSQSSNDKSFEGDPRKKKSKTSHPFAKDLAVLKQLAGKRSNNGKTYAWLGTMVTNQMEDVNIEDRVAASLEVQRVMMKYVQKAQQKKGVIISGSLPLPQTDQAAAAKVSENFADDLVGETCEISTEYLLDEDDFNNYLN